MILPTSALAEVRSDASGYGAEYGRVVGGVTGVVTKSGTNVFHGDFQYIAQNQKWEAQSDDVPLPREDDIINSYEASVGGPIFRDKAWFFAAAADNDTNQISSLAGGDLIQNSVTSESYIGKINFNPTVRHSLVGTYIDAPAVVPFFATIYGDLPTVSEHDLGGSFATVAWTFTAATNLFLEVRAADQDSSESRTLITRTEIVPGASPDDPAGNQSAYWDNTTGLRWHSSALPLGPGVLEFPRQQANVAATWFLSQNELKFGVDYQDVEWESLNQVPDRYMGRGYNPSLPGGFVTPLTKNVYRKIDSPVKTASTNLAAFAADRLELGDRLTLNLGVRYEDQQHENDLGDEVLSSEDFTPRLAAIYDFGGNGKLLAKATAGRYLTAHHPGVHQRGVLDAAQRRQLVRPVQLEPGDPPLRRLRPYAAPAREYPSGGRRTLLQGRGDRRLRVADDAEVGARRARDLVEGGRAVQRHRSVQRGRTGLPPPHQLRRRRARVHRASRSRATALSVTAG